MPCASEIGKEAEVVNQCCPSINDFVCVNGSVVPNNFAATPTPIDESPGVYTTSSPVFPQPVNHISFTITIGFAECHTLGPITYNKLFAHKFHIFGPENEIYGRLPAISEK